MNKMTEITESGIYMIATGNSNSRKIIISMPEHCFMVYLHKNSRISIWYEGLTANEGRQIVDAYRNNSSSAFGKMLKQFSKEHECMGMSESGFYTLTDFTEALSQLKYGIESYAEIIYRGIWDYKSEIKQIA